ncbi:hypothetical protein QFC24_001348 [Naganishia onofrii]|uniref:Uncharacterized protein n=1 Tax=Naganishia onofrii TaxID=1851511 RepID=A0ACC2XU18_9TREE|nr:hypothetical protein QFC24_001348 [Naganishia onofrii]
MSQHPVTEFIPPSTWSLVSEHTMNRLIEIHFSQYAKDLLANLVDFVKNECLPAEHLYHAQLPEYPFEKRWATIIPVMEELKKKARARGLWNLFLSKQHYPEHGVDLTNLEVFARYANAEQQKKYLTPLLNGEIRSSFAMTEFGVASSDATNLRATIRKEGNKVIVNARKWWISGAGDPRNKIHILIGLSDPENPSKHQRHTIVLIPPSTPGVKVVRPLKVFGYDDAPEGHCEVLYDNVVLDEKDCLVGGWGRGFEIIQGRLGPGRIHHCMRSIGTAQRALDMMLTRVSDPARKTFGKYLREHGTILTDIARSRAEIDQARLLVLTAARQIDAVRAKGAMKEIGVAKFTVPTMALQVVDRAMQAFGAEGISQDQPLAQMYAGLRTLRYADGPDEVHLQQIGKQELKRVPQLQERNAGIKKREAQAMREAKL